MRIGELSKRTGISTSRIRFYEKHEVLPQAVRGNNGYRQYPDSTAELLCTIDNAQQLGFSLNEIRRALSEAAPDFRSRATIVRMLRSKLDAIDQHLEEMQGRRHEIVKRLEKLEG
ncbi:MAG TPA: MerR family transcriptional regulator [Acetobacteraceae bacterium]|nr:MerR family transcriptional regulator [Acetobacteraceae bacterium]